MDFNCEFLQAVSCFEKHESLEQKREELEQKRREAEAQATNEYTSNQINSTY
ncbi:631_t:CDS:2 [Ambispora gerdemannii]|uniref:631_t:CDS:1 n=1 Tax=Ambispora gerdemannii TaxID=144530 RepID=A0A9N8ZKG8_9GLOM|nr:631_t:CDS:2 [Ambispora gerdemannii]